MRVVRVPCLAGLIHGGDGARECGQYEANRFSIVRYHYGHFAEWDVKRAWRLPGSVWLGWQQQKSVGNSKYGNFENGP